MRRSFILYIFIILIVPLYPDGNIDSSYANLSQLFGIDPHSGKNSFLTLLIPSGGKYEGMATAFTAISSDSSFLDSNPAGSSFIDNSELTFYHNNWIADVNLESVTLTGRWKDYGVGLGAKFLYLPFTGIDDWGDRASMDGKNFASGYYTETILTGNLSYNFLNDYYYHGISLGANFKLGYRGVPYSIAPGQSAFSAMADLGVQTRFNILKLYSSKNKNFTIGFSLKNLGAEFIENPDPLPSMFSVGISHRIVRPFIWTFDVNIPFNLDGSAPEAINYAMGIDLRFTHFLSLQSGFLLKKGMPRFSVGGDLDFKKFSFTGNYTLDLTTQVRKIDRFSLALKLNLGDNGRQKRYDKAKEIYLEALKLYAEGDVDNAISLWHEALRYDEHFTPAKEMLKIAEKTEELDDILKDNQKIEE